MRRRFAVLVLLAAACSEAPEATAPSRERPLVLTTFYPTAYFVTRIGGSLVDVRCPLPADEDPVFWRPDEAAIRAYQDADLVVLNGAGFEKWAATAPLPSARTVETARPFRSEWITTKGAVTHSHGPKGAHSHEGLDGHTWLDPVNASAQAREIKDALRRRLPAGASEIDAGFASLARDLEALDGELRALGPVRCLASHPAYNYVARRYGWEVQSLDLDPEEVPSPAQAAAAAKIAAEKDLRVLLWEAEPLPPVRAPFDALGLASVVFSPCEQPPPEGDYLSAMRANVARLKAARGG
jgi:zinc transport system substrate-binding protein